MTCTFTVAGANAVTGTPGRRPRQEHRAAHVAEDERAARVHGVEEVLDGEGVGMDAGDDLGDAAMDEVQPLGEAQGGRGRDHALLDQRRGGGRPSR